MSDQVLDPRKLHTYAMRWLRRGEYRTFRQVAKHFRVTYDDIELAVGDFDAIRRADSGWDEGLDIGVGWQIGCGGGHYYEQTRGEWIIDAWSIEPEAVGV